MRPVASFVLPSFREFCFSEFFALYVLQTPWLPLGLHAALVLRYASRYKEDSGVEAKYFVP